MAIKTGKVIIAKNIKLDKAYKNVLSYNETQMLNLVNSKKVAELSTCSFIKIGENVIDTSFSYNDVLKSNYLAIQNPFYSNKWFFGFIDKVEYISDGCSRIYFTVDEYATWFSYWHPKHCFVIREHVNDDTVGLHTVPEMVETGEYICNNQLVDNNLVGELEYMLQVTETITENKILGTNYGGIWSTGGAYHTNNIQVLLNLIKYYSDAGKEDAIFNCYLIPKKLINDGGETTRYEGQSSPVTYNLEISKLTSLNGYTPRNKKLLTFPFCYMLLTNHVGSSNVLRQELFSTNKCTFKVWGTPTPGGSVRISPIQYDGMAIAPDEGLIGGKYPTTSWAGDEYTNWLTQNGVNLALGITSSAITVAGGVALMATGAGAVAGAGAVVSGGLSIASQMGSKYQHSLTPNSARGNTNSGDIDTVTGTNCFEVDAMSIKEEYARCIDDYFDRCGYQINRIKLPNQIGRRYWNYVQIGAEESIGYSTDDARSTPPDSMEIINNIYRRGVTIWHDHDQLGNYNLTNSIDT